MLLLPVFCVFLGLSFLETYADLLVMSLVMESFLNCWDCSEWGFAHHGLVFKFTAASCSSCWWESNKGILIVGIVGIAASKRIWLSWFGMESFLNYSQQEDLIDCHRFCVQITRSSLCSLSVIMASSRNGILLQLLECSLQQESERIWLSMGFLVLNDQLLIPCYIHDDGK